MELEMQVSKWGNSLAIRLPAKVVKELGLKEGDEVEVRATVDKKVVEVAPLRSRSELIDRLRQLRGTMPEGYKFDRDEANSRGPNGED